MAEFLADLDEYIARNYDDYSVISSLRGFRLPSLAGLKRVYALKDTTYNFKPEAAVYRIFYQPNKAELINELKRGYKSFGGVFSFLPIPWKIRLLSFINKKIRLGIYLSGLIKAQGFLPSVFYEQLGLDSLEWNKILRSKLYPSKRLLFKICLIIGAPWKDMHSLLKKIGADFDLSSLPELVVKYLFERRIFGQSLISAAFYEYNIEPL